MSNIERLEKKLEKEPSSIAFAQLAEEYRKVGRIDDAIKTCLEGLKYHPNYWTAYVLLAKCYFEKEEYDKARQYLEDALAGAPDNIHAISLITEVYEKLNMWDKALDKLRILQLLSPTPQTEEKIKRIEGKIKSEEAQEAPTIQFSMSLIKEMISEKKANLDSTLTQDETTEKMNNTKRLDQLEAHELLQVEPQIKEKEADQKQEEISMPEEKPYAMAEKPVELVSLVEQETTTTELSKEEKETEDDITEEISTQTLGEIYASQGCYEKAIKIYQKIILAEPNNIAAINRLKELLDEFNKINVRSNKQFFKEEISQNLPESDKIAQKSDERRKRISTLESWLSTIRKEKKSGGE